MASRPIVIKKLIDEVLTDLYPKTVLTQVLSEEDDKTLAEIITEIYAAVNKKVTAEDGKGLSTEDFTTALKEKLAADYTKAEIDAKLQEINEAISEITGGGAAVDASAVTYVNGDFTNVKEALDSLLYVAPAVNSLTTTSPTVNEIGSSLENIVFNWTLNKEVTSQTFDGQSVTPGTTTYTYAGPLTSNKTFTLKVSDGETEAQRNISISFQNYIYYGVSSETADGTVKADAFVLGLASKKFGTAKSSIGTITVNAAAGEYIYVAIPSAWATSLTFKIGGFDTVFNALGTFTHHNASGYETEYAVFRSGQAGLGSTTMTVV